MTKDLITWHLPPFCLLVPNSRLPGNSPASGSRLYCTYLYYIMPPVPYPKNSRYFLIVPCAVILLIKIFSLSHALVESMYSSGFFQGFAILLRKLTGWIPFSIGDVIYLLAGIWLLLKILKVLILIFKKRMDRRILLNGIRKMIIILLWIYIVFNIFWGLNYNRRGIAYQLNLSTKYDSSDLKKILVLLLQKVNTTKHDLVIQRSTYPGDNELYQRAHDCYRRMNQIYPFIDYTPVSVKTSLYSTWGNYLGFTGYYNPFSGEAQVNHTVPKFIMPYTTCHEIAHQLGYAKEDEANFVGYLAATSSQDTLFQYSTYFDLFLYAY
ncbi:MAG: DUF3810 domain-containing protein, partial [Ginsengibacter sp.]